MKIASIVNGQFHAFDLACDIVCRAASALGKGVGTGDKIRIRNKMGNSGSGLDQGHLPVRFGFLKT
jgi:hypothetical protein